MAEVTIKYANEKWERWGTEDYKPVEYKATLINVVRLDGAWIGIISDEDGIRKINMTKVVEWEDHNGDYRPSDW